MEPRLMRSESDRMIAGVCGGIAAYLGVDSVIVRLAFVVLVFASGIGIPLYIILMVIMPSEANAQAPTSKVMSDNFEEMGSNLNAGMERIRQHPQGPVIAAGLLITLGIYLLLESLGWFSQVWLWPMVLIGLGLFLILRRSKA
ncbi:MAG: PspC domain-containing protein [Candidatus Promineifilaceae bacterium]|nr:PspC domain-containing protein [Candidatus Promineifilaceae bacterium]